MRHQLSAGLLALTCLLASNANAQSTSSNPTYTLTTNYAGSSFFSNFVYNVSVIDNTTQGNIHYVGPSSNLTYINAAGNAVIKIDNTTSGVGDPTFGRNSIKLVSNASYGLGTLYIVDAVHLPYGCSVWPAIWTLSSQYKTDDGGEVDIWEGVNNDQAAQYTMHTKSGCTQSNNTAMPFSAQVVSTNCDYKVNDNQGCAFREKKAGSYGAAFAANGGGVFATLYDANGVQTWFFPRSAIPGDITSGSPSPASWGAPSASWPSPSCDMSTYFTPQNIVINITLCGLWAGAAPIFAQTCSGRCTDYIADPANFNNAYFELRSLKVYGGGRTTPTVTAATQVNSTVNNNNNSNSNKPNAAGRCSAANAMAVLAAGAAAVAMQA